MLDALNTHTHTHTATYPLYGELPSTPSTHTHTHTHHCITGHISHPPPSPTVLHPPAGSASLCGVRLTAAPHARWMLDGFCWWMQCKACHCSTERTELRPYLSLAHPAPLLSRSVLSQLMLQPNFRAALRPVATNAAAAMHIHGILFGMRIS